VVYVAKQFRPAANPLAQRLVEPDKIMARSRSVAFADVDSMTGQYEQGEVQHPQGEMQYPGVVEQPFTQLYAQPQPMQPPLMQTSPSCSAQPQLLRHNGACYQLVPAAEAGVLPQAHTTPLLMGGAMAGAMACASRMPVLGMPGVQVAGGMVGVQVAVQVYARGMAMPSGCEQPCFRQSELSAPLPVYAAKALAFPRMGAGSW